MTRLLLDSHVYLWLLDGDPRLSDAARARIADPGTEPFLSIVSIWELTIKISQRRLDPLYFGNGNPMPHLQRAGLTLLELSLAHVGAIEKLPHLHKDPFDRMLVAQARIEGMQFVTKDRALAAYPDLAVIPA